MKKEHANEKSKLHPRNRNRERYDFNQLIISCPDLASFVKKNIYNDDSIDFADNEAVKMLNKALLLTFYGIKNWDIPEGYLCPPIPGRADYIHHIADLIRRFNYGNIPTGPQFKCVDIGVGANCIYPIIGNYEYGWSFVGSDIDQISLESANQIATTNPSLTDHYISRFQKNTNDIFFDIILENEYYDLTICNPPFHASAEEANAGSLRKLNNLSKEKVVEVHLNFGGQKNELWCEGGESKFVLKMINQSKHYAKSCFLFSTLISKQSNLKNALLALQQVGAATVETIPMGQGNKTSRILAWSFLSVADQKKWRNTRWIVKDVPYQKPPTP